jgi:competence protein ComEC
MNALRLIGLCLGLLLGVPVSAQDLVTPSDRVTTRVNIRAQPAASAAPLGRLEIGEGLPLVSSDPYWYEVRLADGRSGFVSKAWSTISLALAARQENELRIHFLNIGAGSCTVVECPGAGSAPMIVDCGASGAAEGDMTRDDARAYVRDVLAAHQGQPHVVLSHGDTDHYNLIPYVLDEVPVGSVWQGGEPAEYGSGGFMAWLAQQAEAELHRDMPAHFHNDGEPVDALSCGDASTHVLTANTGASKNARSLVLMIRYEDFSVVFTGDAEGVTERQAIANFPDGLRTTVMTSSHHGAATHGSNSRDWVEATEPAVLISSAGSLHFHPRCEAVERFTSLTTTKRHDVRCGTSGNYVTSRTDRAHYVTAVSGTVIVTSNGRSPLTVNCTGSVECGVKIDH